MKHMKKKSAMRIFSAATAAAMMLSSGAFAAETAGTDIEGNWAESTLSAFIDAGYLKGYEDGSYQPNNSVTRAEYMTLINRVKTFSNDAAVDKAAAFSDMAQSGWYYSDVDIALEQGYVKGYEDNTIRPNNTITRQEGFVMIGRLMGLTEDGTREDLKEFSDAADVADWAVPMVGAMVRAGYITGYGEGSAKTLQPQNNMTRAEAVVTLDRQLKAEENNKPTEETYTYVTMNVPYDAFYAAEGITAVDGVDAVTSATQNKSRMNAADKLVAGTYYKDNGETDSIQGVVCTVRVKDSDLAKLNASLTENDDYYYTKLDAVPDNYKALTIAEDGSYSFGKSTAAVDTEALKDVSFTFKTSSNYGDYEMDFSPDVVALIGRAYAATVTTSDGTAYAMRSLENIWNAKGMQLAWSAGFTTTAHGNPLVSDDYVSMMGKAITGVAFYTTDGKIYSMSCDQYVPVKFASTVEIADADISAKTTDISVTGLPDDFDAEYAVEGLTDAAAADGKLTWGDSAMPGSYSLTIKDKSGKYAAVSASFTLRTDAVPAKQDGAALVAAEDVSAEAFANYLSNISSVSVNGTAYSASGKRAVKIVNTETGVIDTTVKSGDNDVFSIGDNTVEITATGYTEKLSLTVSVEGYVVMNVPYDEFYAADLNNDVDVDVFTSATKTKVRTGSLANGSYHVDASGDEIAGISIPVKLGAGVTFEDIKALGGTAITDDSSVDITVTNRGQTTTTTYTGKDALFEAATYSYYVLSETPAVYKEVTKAADGSLVYGETQGTEQQISVDNIELLTATSYGDYQLNLGDGSQLEAYFDHETDKIYGVVVSTAEGADYGMRHLENQWLGYELAWSTGFTDAVHNCPTSSAHYKAMMGQTITSVTYYTSKGIFTVPVDNIYVPVKTENPLTVTNIGSGSTIDAAGGTAYINGITELPEDFSAEYSVDLTDASISSGMGMITWSSALPGTYTLTVTDKSGKYNPLTASFQLSTETAAASYDADSAVLVKADGSSDENFANYLSSITSVSVNGTEYAASGRGAVVLIDAATGALDMSKTTTVDGAETPIFSQASNAVVVTATGYPTLSFDAAFPVEVKTSSAATVVTDDDDPDYGWQSYDVALDVTVQNGVIQSVALNNGYTVPTNSASYFNRALNKINTAYSGQNTSAVAELSVDTVSGATIASNVIIDAVKDAVSK